jgi:hypothetical protein
MKSAFMGLGKPDNGDVSSGFSCAILLKIKECGLA